MKRCFLIGSRQAGEEVWPALCQAVEEHVRAGLAEEFWVGQYGGFDRMAARALRQAKQAHPELRLYLLLAYYRPGKAQPLPEGFDGSIYPPGMERVPRRVAIPRANRYAVDQADCLIACVRDPTGNTRALAEYALARQKRGGLQVTLL